MSKIPEVEEIEKLPRWARVAFAARCARRVLPLFQQYWPDAPKEHLEVVTRAIEVAEQAAYAAHAAYAAIAAAARAAARATAAAARVTADAADAAADAAAAAAYAAVDAAVDAAYAVYAAADAARAAAAFDLSPYIRKDYNTILHCSRKNAWTDETGVPPEVFGPLWPEGPPPGWPTESTNVSPPSSPEPTREEEFALILRAVAETGVSADAVRGNLVELFKALNEYSLEKYGRRLTKDEFKRLIFQSAKVGV